MFKEVWDKITISVAIPLGIAFVAFAILVQFCLENLPYLTCEVEK